MDVEELKAALRDLGLRLEAVPRPEPGMLPFRGYATAEGLPNCACNGKAPTIAAQPWQLGTDRPLVVDVTLCAQLANGMWAEFNIFRLPASDIGRSFPVAKQLLSAAWAGAAADQVAQG